MTKICSTSFYLEVGAVRRLASQLDELDNPNRNFKLSNCLAISNFILNVIKLRCNEGYPPSLMKRFTSSDFNHDMQNHFFFDFQFLKSDGVEKRPDFPTRYQVLNWARNRITHYRADLSKNDPRPWPRGIQIENRGPCGIRSFRITGQIGNRTDSPIIEGRTDRRRFTRLVQCYVHDYIAVLNDEGIDTSETMTTEKMREIEKDA